MFKETDGLSFQTHATQREHEILKRKSEFQDEVKKKKSKAELEEEMREEGLKKSIDSSNKGFALLAKMGYKAGLFVLVFF